MKNSHKGIYPFLLLILLIMQVTSMASNEYLLENKYLRLEVDPERGGRIISFFDKQTNNEWTFDALDGIDNDTTRALGGLIAEHIDRSYPSEAAVSKYQVESYIKDKEGTELVLSFAKFSNYPGLKLIRRMYLASEGTSLEISMQFINNNNNSAYLLSPFVEGFINIFAESEQLVFSIPTATSMQHLTYGKINGPVGFDYWLVPARGWFYVNQGETGLNIVSDFSKVNTIYTFDGVTPYNGVEHPCFEIRYIPFRLESQEEWETKYSISLVEGAITPIAGSQRLLASATSTREEDGKAEAEVSILPTETLSNVICEAKAIRGNNEIKLGEKKLQLTRGQFSKVTLSGFEVPRNGFTSLQLSFRDMDGKELIIDPINPEQYLEIPQWHGKYSREIYPPLAKQGIDEEYVALIKRNALQPDRIRQYAVKAQPKESTGKLILADNNFQIWSEEPLVKIAPDDYAPEGKADPAIKLYGARNERVSFQIVVKPISASGELKLDIQSLVHESGKAKIGNEQIKSYLQKYIQTEIMSTMESEIGRYPDPLVECKSFTINSQENHPLWFTVYIPEGMPAGTYNGTWSILSDNKQITEVEILLNVWDFSLPVTSNLRTHFSIWDQYITSRHNISREDPKFDNLLRKYRENMLEHRLSFGSLGMPEVIDTNGPIYNFEKYDRELEYYLERGLNAFSIGGSYPLAHVESKSEKKKQINTLKPICDHLEQRGLLDMSYNYIWDEPLKTSYPAIAKAAEIRKETHPDLKTLLTVDINEELRDSIDIWTPIVCAFNEKEARAEQEKGKEVWWYVCCGPKQPWPNFFIDTPAITHRLLFWMTYKYNLDGMLYWSTTYWGKDVWKEAESWPGANGEGSLMYWDEDGPVNSLRLEVIRDGVQDYDYFRILEQKLDQLKALGRPEDQKLIRESECVLALPDTLIRTPMDYERSPEKLISARKTVGAQIEKITKRLDF